MSKELTTKQSFAVLASPDASSIMKATFDAGLSLYRLPKIKVPAGGGIAFTLEGGLDGDDSKKEIECVIAGQRPNMRSWYRQADGPLGNAPDCSSIDGRTGLGNNIETGSPDGEGIHNCLTCPWGQRGSDRKGGKGADCKEFSEVYVFVGQNRVPNLLKIPRSSKKAFIGYNMILANAGHTINTVVTKLTLKKVQNKANISYSEISFSFVRALTADELAVASSISGVLASAFAQAAFNRGNAAAGDDGDLD